VERSTCGITAYREKLVFKSGLIQLNDTESVINFFMARIRCWHIFFGVESS
jgi:hypothetical protein